MAWEPQIWWGKEPKKRKKFRAEKVEGQSYGFLEIVSIEVKASPYYDRDYRTGWCMVRCLVCGPSCPKCEGQPFRMRLSKISHALNTKKDCGCMPRIRKARRPDAKKAPGRVPADLTNIIFGQLEPIVHYPGQGWWCTCTCGRGCVVRHSHQLLRGSVTACQHCAPSQWDRPPRGKPGVKKPSRLWYLRPDAASHTPGTSGS